MPAEPYYYLMNYGLFHAVVIFSGSLVIGLDVGELKAIMVLFVKSEQPYAKNQSKHAERCKHQHRHSVVIFQRIGHTGVGCRQNITYKDGEEEQAYILHPENQRVGAPEEASGHDLWH